MDSFLNFTYACSICLDRVIAGWICACCGLAYCTDCFQVYEKSHLPTPCCQGKTLAISDTSQYICGNPGCHNDRKQGYQAKDGRLVCGEICRNIVNFTLAARQNELQKELTKVFGRLFKDRSNPALIKAKNNGTEGYYLFCWDADLTQREIDLKDKNMKISTEDADPVKNYYAISNEPITREGTFIWKIVFDNAGIGNKFKVGIVPISSALKEQLKNQDKKVLETLSPIKGTASKNPIISGSVLTICANLYNRKVLWMYGESKEIHEESETYLDPSLEYYPFVTFKGCAQCRLFSGISRKETVFKDLF